MTKPTCGQVNACAFTAVALAGFFALPAQATDGYFSHGYGMKSMGMGGASVAMTDNAFAGANSPAVAACAGTSDNAVKSSNVNFNILAPGGITNHFRLGGTYVLSQKSELTVPYMYATANSVTSASMYNAMGLDVLNGSKV